MTSEQKLLLAGFIGVVGLQLSSIHGWGEALKPAVVGASLVQFGLFLRALYTKAGN